MTLSEIKDILWHRRLNGSNNAMLRFSNYHGMFETDHALVMRAFAQIEQAIMLVEAHIEAPSAFPAEILLLQMFSDIAEGGVLPQ